METAKTALLVIVAAVGLQFLPVLFTPSLHYTTHGKVDHGFESVQKAFEYNFIKGMDFEGSAFAVCHKGKMVVDLWGGYADSTSNRLWNEDTMTLVFSTTKGVSALCLAVLVDRGYLKYSDLVTKHWPEFGQNGKDQITVKMLASHQAGLVILDEQITVDVIKDWRKMSKAFEKQKPNWKVGTQSGYHGFTLGWLIDQLVRRVDPKKRSLGQFFHEEIAVPHNLDFYIGLPLDLEHKVARLVMPRLQDTITNMADFEFLKMMFSLHTASSDSLLRRLTKNPDFTGVGGTAFNNPEMHALEIGAANGIGTARALAQLFCLLNNGKLVSKATLDQISTPVVTQKDNVIPMVLSQGWGFFHTKNPKGQYIFGHPGYGGNNVKYDLNYHLAFAYVRNGLAPHMTEAPSFLALQDAVYHAMKTMHDV